MHRRAELCKSESKGGEWSVKGKEAFFYSAAHSSEFPRFISRLTCTSCLFPRGSCVNLRLFSSPFHVECTSARLFCSSSSSFTYSSLSCRCSLGWLISWSDALFCSRFRKVLQHAWKPRLKCPAKKKISADEKKAAASLSPFLSPPRGTVRAIRRDPQDRYWSEFFVTCNI